MIQYPINVSPQNRAIDATSGYNGIGFKFQGDFLSTCWLKVFDYETKELVVSSFSSQDAYNGDSCGHNIPANTLTNGRKYVYQMELIQKKNDFVNDMPVLGGRIRGTTEQNGILISDGITDIYPFSHTGNVYSRATDGNVVLDNMVIKIGNESHNIVSYTTGVEIDGEMYGVIAVDEPFVNTLSANAQYQIYSSFIVTPQYFINCTETPTVTLSATCGSPINYCYVTGAYEQSQNVLIKYYSLKMYWSNNALFANAGSHGEKSELLFDTGKIFSQDIYFIFKNYLRHSIHTLSSETDYYKIVCEGETSDSLEFKSSDCIFASTVTDYSQWSGNRLWGFSLSWDNKVGAVKYLLSGNFSALHAQKPEITRMLNRKNLISGEESWLIPDSVRYEEEFAQSLLFTDITASCRGKYRYTLYAFDSDMGIIKPVIQPDYYDGIGDYPCNDIETREYSYYISDLILSNPVGTGRRVAHENTKPSYLVGDTWRISGEISDTTITCNTDNTVHVGYNKYAKTTSTDVNYMSGTLSGLLGYVDCTTQEFEDNVELVQSWRKFITQKKPFLLKSQKGDVWIVEITDSPTTQYGEKESPLLTTFTFSWAECCGINDVYIQDTREG